MINLLFFGPIAERTGCREMLLDHAPGMKVHDVLIHLQAHYPAAWENIHFMAINEVQTRDPAAPLYDGEVVAFMTPFSGG